MSTTIKILYSCPPCGLVKVGVDVGARAEGEPIKEWMDKVVLALAVDHRFRSPRCHPKQLKDVMIPITGAKQIGGEAEN